MKGPKLLYCPPSLSPQPRQETHSHSGNGNGGRFIIVMGKVNGCCSWQPLQPDRAASCGHVLT